MAVTRLVRCVFVASFAISVLIFFLYRYFTSSSSSSSSSTPSSSSIITESPLAIEAIAESHLLSTLITEFKISTHSSSSIYITEKPFFFPLSSLRSTPISHLNGILFIAHACSHSAYDFWPQSYDGKCHLCTGLAEEVEIVKAALSQKFLVIAISSLDRDSGCWSLNDLPVVTDILTQTQKSIAGSSSNLPIFGLGCSSGGRFLWKLFQQLQKQQHAQIQIDGMIIQSMSIPLHTTSLFPAQHPPPIIFNPMVRDQFMYKAVLENNHSLITHHHYPPPLVQVQICHPVPLIPSYLASRLQHINLTNTEATLISSLFTTHGFLNEAGYLIVDPTEPLNDWRLVLSSTLPSETLLKLNFTPGHSPLAKVIHRCWAYHEYCADEIKHNLLWMKFMRIRQRQGLPLIPEQD